MKKWSLYLLLFIAASAGNAFAKGHCDPKPGEAEKTAFQDKASGDWKGLRTDLRKKGVEFELKVIPEGFDNFCGGVHRGTVGALTADFGLKIDMEKAYGWKGGYFYLDFEDHAGRNPTIALIGGLQAFDKYNYTHFWQIYSLWYQQTFREGKLRFKVGKADLNAEFCVIENGLPFLNNSTQISPAILSAPTYPDPTPSFNLFFKPNKSWYAAFGIYDANLHDTFGVFYGNVQNVMLTEYGAMLIGETGFIWERAPVFNANGNFKVGIWRHTGRFPCFEGGKQHGAIGYYVIFNQTLQQPENASVSGITVRSFLSFGQTQKSAGVIDWNFSGGITAAGLWKSRQNDLIGFSANYAHISPQAGLRYSYELALEWMYRMKAAQWILFLPDLQYIIHPGGQYRNALVGTLHMRLEF